MLPSSVEEGTLWPKAIAGVVVPRVFQPPRAGFRQRNPSLSKEGTIFWYLCHRVIAAFAHQFFASQVEAQKPGTNYHARKDFLCGIAEIGFWAGCKARFSGCRVAETD